MPRMRPEVRSAGPQDDRARVPRVPKPGPREAALAAGREIRRDARACDASRETTIRGEPRRLGRGSLFSPAGKARLAASRLAPPAPLALLARQHQHHVLL